MKGHILTDADKQEAAELRERGLTYGQMRRRFASRGIAVSQGALSWACLQLGADLPPERRKTAPRRTGPMKRGNHVVRPFTPEEDAELSRLAVGGLGATEISRRLGTGRAANSITGRLLTLARQQARAEDAAE